MFHFVSWFVCLSVNKITQKVVDRYSRNFCEGRLFWIRTNQLDHEGDRHSDLDPRIISSLSIYNMQIALLYYCSLGISPWRR